MESNHLTDADLHGLRSGGLTAEQIAAAGQHLAVCSTCAAAARQMIPIVDALRAIDFAIGGDEGHPAVDDLFAYVDGALDRKHRREIDAHLTHCRICREDVDDARAVRRSMTRRPRATWWQIAAALVVVVGLSAVGVWLAARRPRRSESPFPAAEEMRSVAVLPLQNGSPGRADDFLAVALADALTGRLQQIPSLLVPPTSAVLALRAHNVGVATDGIITGEFTVAGDRIHATIRLTDSRTHSTRWNTSVEMPRDDLAALLDVLSDRTLAAVSRETEAPLVARSSIPRSSNRVAFQQYLEARALENSLVPSETAGAIAHLKRAVELDPHFAAAYADLSLAITMRKARGQQGALPNADDAERYAREAVRLDPQFAAGHVALARAIVRSPGRFREAMQEEATALQLNARDTETLALLASYLAARGDAARIECVVDYLQRLDPTSSQVRLRGYWYLDALDRSRLLPAAASALASPSTALAGADLSCNEWLLRGDLTRAQQFADQATALAPHNYLGASLTAMVAAAKGDTTGATTALRQFEPEAMTNHFAAMRQALCYARLGDRQNALLWMQRAEASGNRFAYFWTHHPWFQPLRNDPEFQKLIAQMRADLDSVQGGMTGAADAICGVANRHQDRQ